MGVDALPHLFVFGRLSPISSSMTLSSYTSREEQPASAHEPEPLEITGPFKAKLTGTSFKLKQKFSPNKRQWRGRQGNSMTPLTVGSGNNHPITQQWRHPQHAGLGEDI